MVRVDKQMTISRCSLMRSSLACSTDNQQLLSSQDLDCSHCHSVMSMSAANCCRAAQPHPPAGYAAGAADLVAALLTLSLTIGFAASSNGFCSSLVLTLMLGFSAFSVDFGSSPALHCCCPCFCRHVLLKEGLVLDAEGEPGSTLKYHG